MTNTVEPRIIDAHVHLWDAPSEKYPYAAGFEAVTPWLPTFTPEQHFAYSGQVGKVRMNLVQMTWYGLDHSYILDLIASDPETFVGTGIVAAVTDISLAEPAKQMVALSKRGCYAFRQREWSTGPLSGNSGRWMDYDGYDQMYQAGADNNLALSYLMGQDGLPEVDRMCTKYPETPIILDHVSGCRIKKGVFPEEALERLCAMSKHKRLMIKLGPFQALTDAGSPYLDLLPMIRRLTDAFGPERIMWESDSGGPVQMPDPHVDFPAAIALIRDHTDFLSEGDKDQILRKTAEDFFFNR